MTVVGILRGIPWANLTKMRRADVKMIRQFGDDRLAQLALFLVIAA